MEEVFPVGSGVILGLAVAYLVRRRLGVAVLAACSVLLGMTASWISGELAVSWIYVPIDIAQVSVTGALTWVLAARWRRVRGAVPRRSL